MPIENGKICSRMCLSSEMDNKQQFAIIQFQTIGIALFLDPDSVVFDLSTHILK